MLTFPSVVGTVAEIARVAVSAYICPHGIIKLCAITEIIIWNSKLEGFKNT